MKPTQKFDSKGIFNTTVLLILGQVGCVTLVIILAAILLGLWIDKNYGTEPMFALIGVGVSIPFSILAMVRILRSGIKKLQAENAKLENPSEQEETDFGGKEEI